MKTGPNFVGVELYFEHPDAAKRFHTQLLGLELSEEQSGRFVKFDSPSGFICLERKGSESYLSSDKAVLFFEVGDLDGSVTAIGREHFVQVETTWAVLHDPEGHNVLLLQRGQAE